MVKVYNLDSSTPSYKQNFQKQYHRISFIGEKWLHDDDCSSNTCAIEHSKFK